MMMKRISQEDDGDEDAIMLTRQPFTLRGGCPVLTSLPAPSFWLWTTFSLVLFICHDIYVFCINHGNHHQHSHHQSFFLVNLANLCGKAGKFSVCFLIVHLQFLQWLQLCDTLIIFTWTILIYKCLSYKIATICFNWPPCCLGAQPHEGLDRFRDSWQWSETYFLSP